MKTPTTQSRTTILLASGAPPGLVVVALFVASLLLCTLRGVHGLVASRSTSYSDTACEDSSGYVLRFGVPDALNASIIHGFNECVAFPSANASIFHVCNVTTGEVGLNFFEGTTCTVVYEESAAVPSCEQASPSSAECTAAVCAQVQECTDAVASTISPGVVNFLANEYNDANCTDPTGNTGVLSGENIGQISGECFELPGIAYAMGECRADGSFIAQFFSPEDDTCSGLVWDETTSATEYSPPICISTAINGLYYGFTSCTTEASTVLYATPTPAPTIALTTAPTMARTPAPTIAPTAAADTPAPTAGDGSRGIGETASPLESDQAGDSNGAAAGTGSSVAVGSGVLSCVVGLWVFIAM